MFVIAYKYIFLSKQSHHLIKEKRIDLPFLSQQICRSSIDQLKKMKSKDNGYGLDHRDQIECSYLNQAFGMQVSARVHRKTKTPMMQSNPIGTKTT